MNVLIGAGVVALSVVGFLGWLAAVRLKSRRGVQLGAADPSTMELGEEPPAIVNLLVHELSLTGDAFAATLLDLAARRALEVVQLSPDHHLVRLRRAASEPVRTDFDGIVLRAVRAAAPDGDATVEELAASFGAGSANTWWDFSTSVTQAAVASGLVARSSATDLVSLLMLLAVLACLGMIVMLPGLLLLSPVVFLGLVFGGGIIGSRRRSLVLTDAGRAAGRRWLGVQRFIEDHGTFEELPAGAVEVWDRYLAYGAALGLADEAVHGVVSELRTTLSVTDARAAGRFLRDVVRMQRDPAYQAEWAKERRAEIFGPDGAADELFGPETGDFWTLLSRVAKSFGLLMFVARSCPDDVRRAVTRRLDSLVRSAPPDLADDVVRLAPLGEAYVSRMLDPDAAPMLPSADDVAAAERLLAAVARHVHAAPEPESVLRALAAVPEPSSERR